MTAERVRESEAAHMHRGGDEAATAAYARLAPVYDWIFGAILQPGRVRAIEQLRAVRGTDVLEIGVGTAINAALYPREYTVTGIDASRSMLERAGRRLTARGIANIRLLEMDAAALAFDDHSFDVVFAAYVITAVSNPVAVAREMHRVCRHGGHVVLLSHFLSDRQPLARVERAIARFTPALGFHSSIALEPLLTAAGLDPVAMHPVNVPPLWRLVVCRKDAN